jgi:ribosomal protein S27AE
MPRRGKIDLEKIRRSLNTVCPLCGYSITPAEVVLPGFDEVKCPKCGGVFGRKNGEKRLGN